MNSLRENVLAAREQLAQGNRLLAEKHRSGCSGLAICQGISDLRDEVIGKLFRDALRDLDADGSKELESRLPWLLMVAMDIATWPLTRTST